MVPASRRRRTITRRIDWPGRRRALALRPENPIASIKGGDRQQAQLLATPVPHSSGRIRQRSDGPAIAHSSPTWRITVFEAPEQNKPSLRWTAERAATPPPGDPDSTDGPWKTMHFHGLPHHRVLVRPPRGGTCNGRRIVRTASTAPVERCLRSNAGADIRVGVTIQEGSAGTRRMWHRRTLLTAVPSKSASRPALAAAISVNPIGCFDKLSSFG